MHIVLRFTSRSRKVTFNKRLALFTKLARPVGHCVSLHKHGRHQMLFIPRKGKENIEKTQKGDEQVLATKFGFGCRLCKEKVLSPLTSVVLNEIHSCCSNQRVCYI